jgi:DNA polymerase
MTPIEILQLLSAHDIRVRRTGVTLVIDAPKGSLDPTLRRLVTQYKTELLEFLGQTEMAPDAHAKKLSPSADAHDTHDAQDQPSTGARQLEPRGPDAEANEPAKGSGCVSRATCVSEKSPAISASTLCASAGTTATGSAIERAVAPVPVFLDFETRSLASLDEVGGRTYACHASTQVLCAVAKLPAGRWLAWTPGEPPPEELFALVASGVPVVAHNAFGFDRFIWESLAWPNPKWIDTLPIARLSGLPGSLDGIGEIVLGRPKDKEGRRLALALSRPDRRTGLLPPVLPAALARVKQYCASDVGLLADAWPTLYGAIDVEADVRATDLAINDRGFAFDAALAHAVIDCEARLVRDLQRAAPVSGKVLASHAQLRRWLATAGVHVNDIRRGTVEELLDDPDLADDVRRVVVARLASSTVTSNKLRAALRRLGTDGRLRDTLVYHAAHTGRWGGRAFQPQNLPRGIKSLDINAAIEGALARDIDGLGELAAAAGASVGEVLATLVRSCVYAPPGRVLGVIDYASIEARALAWLSRDEEALAGYRRGECPYKIMAATLFGIELAQVSKEQRNLGKVPVLGAGYQMGAERLETYSLAFNIDWTSLPVTPAHVVEAWRDAHPLVAGSRTGDVYEGHVLREGGLWRGLEQAALRAAAGEHIEISCVAWDRVGSAVTCTLPSGRKLVYPGAQAEPMPTRWGKAKTTFSYLHHGQRIGTYGGKLTENITQAVCRDLLADALVRLEHRGFPAVLHVHDEVVSELSCVAELDEMKAIMSSVPTWAEGLLLGVDGYAEARYRK